MGNRSRWTLRGLLPALLLGLLGCGDGDSTFLRVQVASIPEQAQSLLVYTMVDGELSEDAPQVPISERPSLSLGLRIIGRRDGQVAATVGALDAQGCLLASADGFTAIHEGDRALDLQAILSALPGAQRPCALGSPLLLALAPAEMYTSGRSLSGDKGLTVRGWGLRPSTQLQVGGNPQCARVLSFAQLSVAEPQLQLPPGPARVELSAAGQTPSARDDLIRISMAPPNVRWSTPSVLAPSASLLAVAEGMFGDAATPSLAVLDRYGTIFVYQSSGLQQGSGGLRALAGAGVTLSQLSLNPAHTGTLLAGDVDGDGAADLVAVTTAGSAVLHGDGAAHFGIRSQLPALQGQDAALADIDGDGRLDLVRAGAVLAVHRNPGSGIFALTSDQQPLLSATSSVRAADLDGDGWTDVIALAAPPAGDVLIFHNERGTLQLAQRLLLRACSAADVPPILALSDLDGDGALDVAVNGSAALLLNRAGRFDVQYIAGLAPCFGGLGLAVLDINGDGASDLLWVTDSGISALLNPGRAGFDGTNVHTQSLLPLPPEGLDPLGFGPRRLPVLDLNADGRPDLVLGTDVLINQSPAPPLRGPCTNNTPAS